ncbi:hypothetical protein EVJ58_g2508 [Rhodofomes roseus]|uniref:Transmembrane protein n=1 Tax=Rhodofomes roseus TaxID=34475 RepID=A0A4Y9YPY4_9APHY|nr:hypothetical protein EVJ58_g2508 [Rhodofomes roseus]
MAIRLAFGTGHIRLPEADPEVADDATLFEVPSEPQPHGSEETVLPEPTPRSTRSYKASRSKRSSRAQPERTGLSSARLLEEFVVHEALTQERPSRMEQIVVKISGYISSCVCFAAVYTICSLLFTLLAECLFGEKEPYASNTNIVYASAWGAAILSLPFTNVVFAYCVFEAWYEAKHKIYEPPSELPRWWTSQQRDSYVPPRPRLAQRYETLVTWGGFLSGLVLSGLLGPVIGTVLQLSELNDAMTPLAALKLGGASTGLFLGTIIIIASFVVSIYGF